VRSNCLICNCSIFPDASQNREQHSPRYWSLTHYEGNHQDYLLWKKSKRRVSTILGVLTAIIVAVVLALVPRISDMPTSDTGARGGAELAIVLGVIVFFISTLLTNRWGIRKFRREWMENGAIGKDEHSSDPSQIPSLIRSTLMTFRPGY
jgi:hypothetical protein